MRDVQVAETALVEHLEELLGVGADLLQADHVGAGRGEPGETAATRGSADPVDVGGDDGEHLAIQPAATWRPARG